MRQIIIKGSSNLHQIVVFVEGKTELIFLHTFLKNEFGNYRFSAEFLRIPGNGESAWALENPDSNLRFLVFDCQGDGNVVSAIRDRKQTLFKKGTGKIIGLKDMYSNSYDKKSNGQLLGQLNEIFIENTQSIINDQKVSFHFSIMEFEAWFLGMYKLFPKLDSSLTIARIEEVINCNIEQTDPQNVHYRPSMRLKKVLDSVGKTYNKSESDIHRICNKVEPSDINNSFERDRCRAFKKFFDEIKADLERYGKRT